MRVGVITFPGTNRAKDAIDALSLFSTFKVTELWHQDTGLPKLDLIILPGGFSHGDYLRCGAMAAQSAIMKEVVKAAHKGVKVLGICNGFQILCESGLLPGVLMRNKDQKFVCRNSHILIERNDTCFTRSYQKGQIVRYPVAHGEGNYFALPETLKRIEENHQVVFRYSGPNGEMAPQYNFNGSQNSIAGVINENGNVLGLMPHPENCMLPWQGGEDGQDLFNSMLENIV